MTHSARPHLEFSQSFSVESGRERFGPDGDGGQVPEPKGSVGHRRASFLPKQEKLALGKETDRTALFVSGVLSAKSKGL